MLQLRASDVERGGGGKGGDDGLGEKACDHSAATDSQENEENPANQTQRADRCEILRLVGFRVDEGESTAHHHRYQSEGTDVHVARGSERPVHEHGSDAPVEAIDGGKIRQHRVGHALGVRGENKHSPEELP